MRRWTVLAVYLGLSSVALGAEPQRHWSFEPPRRPILPSVQNVDWPVNAIDYFILAGLEAARMSPSPRADRATLLRRITLDLTGIPPSLDEQDANLITNQPDSHAWVAERLLASPRFGERMAVPWLDAARYADTHGFLIDAHRDMGRWRDWVIDAYNDNLPFDQFTVQQLAGDLLPSPSLDQLIATGFNRNHMINYENGADPEEYRVEYAVDRGVTTASVWLGITMQCARCHDHKYDPVSQREFYQWTAFFANVDERGLDGNVGNAVPFVTAPTAEQERQLAEYVDQLARVESVLRDKRSAALATMSSWESSLKQGREMVPESADFVFRGSFDDPQQLVFDSRGRAMEGVEPTGNVMLVPGRRDRALLLDGRTHLDVEKADWPVAATGITLSAWVFPTTGDSMAIAVQSNSRNESRLSWHIDSLVPELRIGAGGESFAAGRSRMMLDKQRWQHVAVTWDGTSSGTLHWFRDGLAVESEGSPNRPLADLTTGSWRLGGDHNGRGFRGLIDEFRVYPRELSATEVARLAQTDPIQAALVVPASQRTAAQQELLCDAYLVRTEPEYSRAIDRRDQLRLQQRDFRRTVKTAMVMRERSEVRPTYVLRRGKFDQHGELVEPGTPSILPEFTERFARTRLGLAEWLIQPDHPLTARVMVNRLWQTFFGTGLVRTPEDFGLRGDPPTHPELLDWLAVEFVESGWDLKHMVRLIVTSATYCQSSRVDRQTLEYDPENRWLARAPRLRMEAEAVRDMLLATSGLMDARIGGSSVFPYQPAGLWEEVSFNPDEFSAQEYVPSHGSDLYRRGLYTFWKRTLPPPAMVVFDAPTRETCVLQRGRSNTPLQALVLMNDPLSIEAARQLAMRGLHEHPHSPEALLAFLFRSATSRSPTLGEKELLRSLYQRQLGHFQENPGAADRLLAVGESPRDSLLQTTQLAAWTIVASAIFCLDETITRN